MNKNSIITIVLVILIVITAVQAIQLNTIKTKISTGTLNVGAAQANTQTKTQAPVANVPTMVGGC